MSLERARERFEHVLDALMDLARDNADVPVVVEGPRDAACLRALGCRGRIVVLNGGQPIAPLAENVAREARRVILLMDWDERGRRHHEALAQLLQANAARADASYRERLRRDVPFKDVESLRQYVERGLARHHRLTLVEHVARSLDA